jgi:4-nitrophenyl phosphatase
MLPAQIKSLILDMDGVLWRDDMPIGDLPSIFDRIKRHGIKVAFATNNGSRTPEQYTTRLANFGVTIEPWQVITSALGVAELLSRHFELTLHETSPTHSSDKNSIGVFAIGEAGVMTALHSKGFRTLEIEDAHLAQAVVMGIDRQISFQKMAEAALLVRRGVPFFATNPDKTFPTPRGEIPGAGAWISTIITATGIEPIYAGKPAPYLLELARERLGTVKDETLVVGDRLETDIAGGQSAGMPVALVLSGVSTRPQAEVWTPAPDYLAEDLEQLIA